MSQTRHSTDSNTHAGARRGEQVLQRLRENPPNIWYPGEQVRDVTTHPALRGGVITLARLYDLQWEHADKTLFDSPSSGRKVARSFMLPRPHEELRSISVAMKVWEDHTHGMMGRVPDYINRAMSGYAAGAAFLGEADPRFGANAIRYHEYLREQDLCLTHTLIPPQANRAVSSASQADPFLAARVKEETDAGIVIRGCRMLATLPISDEIMVFPSTLLKSAEEDAPYAFGFSIPNHTPGSAFHLPRERGLRAVAFRSPARLALRGNGCGRGIRRCVRAVGKRPACTVTSTAATRHMRAPARSCT